MKTSLWRVALLAVLLLLGGCASQRAVTMAKGQTALPPPDTTSASGAYEGGSEYRIGAQDLLQITVFGVPDLSRDVRVNSNGQVSLPLIGGVLAGGKTIPELEQEIADKLSKSYLQNPQVSVFVKEYTSQRVTLDGALAKPGIYSLTGKTTLLQAVAMAGGLDPLAERDGVVVFRQVDGKKMAAVFNLAKISTGEAADPRIYGDDIIVVARSGSKSAVQQLIQSAPILALFFLL
ncbi:MAG TPA: polysaccharide biosynthesis/export family protein [Rhodanobacteraceae bacterium]|nr:polysaccharide biosynthesis/export family protein [Rhodanobacteraceae bacterium]